MARSLMTLLFSMSLPKPRILHPRGSIYIVARCPGSNGNGDSLELQFLIRGLTYSHKVRLIDGGERLGTNFFAVQTRLFDEAPNVRYTHAKPVEKQNTGKRLEDKISDITVTLKSSDWLDLPDTEMIDEEIKFPEDLRDRYRLLEEELVIQLQHDQIMNVAQCRGSRDQAVAVHLRSHLRRGEEGSQRPQPQVRSPQTDRQARETASARGVYLPA